MTLERSRRMDEVLQNRSRYVCIVLEDTFQSHNASAVLRSCDAFGIQDIYIIENQYSYSTNPDVDMGSDKWLTLHFFKGKANNTADCISVLKSAGYLIVAATPHPPSISLSEMPIDRPLAIMLGTEQEGLSETALEMADLRISIPMLGFTESFNLSVCAALFLQTVRNKMNESGVAGGLTDEEKIELKLDWAKNSVRGATGIESRFLEKKAAK